MKRKLTAQIADSDLVKGIKPYLNKARAALPVLVRQAKAGRTIFYSELAEILGMPNARNLNYPLGAIGRGLIALENSKKIKIPPIQCLVINKQSGLPGAGIGWFLNEADFGSLDKAKRANMVRIAIAEICSFQHWDWVLKQFSLQPLTLDLDGMLEKAKRFRGHGESVHHRAFKTFISEHPELVGLTSEMQSVRVEYKLPSSDSIDVLFDDGEKRTAVEVKSFISGEDDILRGLFQCVKYKYLVEAEQVFKNQYPNAEAILVLERKLPEDLIIVKNLLGIKVIDNIQRQKKELFPARLILE